MSQPAENRSQPSEIKEQITADYRKYSLKESLSYNWQGRKASIISSLCLIALAGVVGGAAIYLTPFMSSAALSVLIASGVLFGVAITVKFLLGKPYKLEREPQLEEEMRNGSGPASFFKALLVKVQINWEERKLEIITAAISTLVLLGAGLCAIQLAQGYSLISLAAMTTLTVGEGTAFGLYFLLKRPQRPTPTQTNVQHESLETEGSQSANNSTNTSSQNASHPSNSTSGNGTSTQPNTQTDTLKNNGPNVLNFPAAPKKEPSRITFADQRLCLYHILQELGFEEKDVASIKKSSFFDNADKIRSDLIKIFRSMPKTHPEIRSLENHSFRLTNAQNRLLDIIQNKLKDPEHSYNQINSSSKNEIERKYACSPDRSLFEEELCTAIFTELWIHYIESVPFNDGNPLLPLSYPSNIPQSDLDSHIYPRREFSKLGLKCYLKALIHCCNVGLQRDITFDFFNFSNLKLHFTQEIVNLIGEFLALVRKSGRGENEVQINLYNNPIRVDQMDHLLEQILKNNSSQKWIIYYPYEFPINDCSNYTSILERNNQHPEKTIRLVQYLPSNQDDIEYAKQFSHAFASFAPGYIEEEEEINNSTNPPWVQPTNNYTDLHQPLYG